MLSWGEWQSPCPLGHVTLAAISETIILIPYDLVMSLQYIWRPGTKWWTLKVPICNQQPWYWPCKIRISKSLSFMRNYLTSFNVPLIMNKIKGKYISMFPKNKFSMTMVKWIAVTCLRWEGPRIVVPTMAVTYLITFVTIITWSIGSRTIKLFAFTSTPHNSLYTTCHPLLSRAGHPGGHYWDYYPGSLS